MNGSSRIPFVSFVIPTLSAPAEIYILIKKIININGAEIIVVNQNPAHKISKGDFDDVKEVMLDKPVSASEARNLGVSVAKGEFIFFLDDDADLMNIDSTIVDYLSKNLNKVDVLVFDRCHKRGDELCSYNPGADHWVPNHWSMSKFVTEWNVCLRRNVFQKAGMFPLIGTGSTSKAQSGEMFVLFASLCNITNKIFYYPAVQVLHPPYAGKKPLLKCLGYYYGAGYSVGLSLPYFSFPYKFIWVIRAVAAAIRDLFLPESLLLKPSDYPAHLFYKFKICAARTVGLFDGIHASTFAR